MVFPEDVDLAVDALECPAVAEEQEFQEKRKAHDGDGRGMEIFGLAGPAGVRGARDAVAGRGVPLGELHAREHDEDEGDGGHEEAEDDVARRLDAGFARGELARVDPPHGAVAQHQRDVGQRVEDGVRHGREQGQGARVRRGEKLQAGEQDVGGEGAPHRDLVLQLVIAVELLCEPDMLVHGAEPALDVVVLGFVKMLELLALGGRFVRGDGPASITFAGGGGTDRVDLLWGFDFG